MEAFHPDDFMPALGMRAQVRKITDALGGWREGKRAKVTSFPVRVGYATTIRKVQGATLDSQG